MLFNHLKLFFRRTHSGYRSVNIFGLAVGLAACFLILLWIDSELRFDRFHEHAGSLYRVITEQHQAGQTSHSAETQYPLAPGLKADFPEIGDACRVFTKWGDMFIRKDYRFFVENRVLFVDASFLSMFSFPMKAGDIITALKDPYTVVLTEEMALKYFGEQDPIDEYLEIEYGNTLTGFQVTGVLESIPENSHLQFDFLLPFSIFETLYADVDNLWHTPDNYVTYVQLRENEAVARINQAISNYKAIHLADNRDILSLQPVASIHLYSNVKFDSPSNSSYRYIYLFAAIALFVLIIACINYINLSTARSEKRAKEVGLRKVFGAQRRQLVGFFFTESILQSLLALAVAVLLVLLALPWFNQLSGKNLSLSAYRPLSFVAILAGITLCTGVLAGSYPALYLSSFRPALVLKGLAGSTRAYLRDSFLRQTLLFVQFSLSISLVISTVIVSNQLAYLRGKDLGFDQKNIIEIPVRGNFGQHYETFKSELLKLPEIAGVTAANILPTHGNESILDDWEGKIDDHHIVVNITSVAPDYIETMNMEIARGRSFSSLMPMDMEQSVIVNEEAVRQMGLSSPIGKKVWGRSIIGIVRDYHFTSLHEPIQPMVLFPTDLHHYHIFIHANITGRLLDRIGALYQSLSSEYPFEYRILNNNIAQFYEQEARTYKIFFLFMMLALFVAGIGLFSLTSFSSEQRAKEIGIRKVMGASTPGILLLLTSDYSKLVFLANLLAWPIAWFAMNQWLQNFAYRISVGWLPFVVAGMVIFLFVLITVGALSLQASQTNPVEVLRHH